ncbi:MAG: tRNA dihydrouridine(16) synthase DusC, partial [Hafnia sp.]
WLGYLRKEYTEASEVFSEIRALKTSPDIARAIERL